MRPSHLPVLDGLRAVAVLLVMWVHVPQVVPGYPEWLKFASWLIGPGGLGVEIFFVLSGFLITRILMAEREQGLPVRWFLLRRLLRIFPIYYLLLLVMLPQRPAAEIGWCALYLYNVKSIFWPQGGPLEHTWSLCIEEHFYLLWPLVVAFAKPGRAGRVLAFGVMPLAIVGALLVCLFVDADIGERAVPHGSPFRFLSLGAGSLLAFRETWLRARPRQATQLALGLLAAAIVLHPHVWFLLGPLEVGPIWSDTKEWLPRSLAPFVVLVHSGALCTGLVLLGVLAEQQRRSPLRVLTARPLRAIGRISYALYLYHLPIYFALVVPEPTAARAWLSILLSFIAATVSYFAVERPLQRFGARFRGAARAQAR
ncbi:MAG TPA: acyltransferase [Planctomycetota bacterium]|nr:acyltransferase [Planctomycetota bacterium]